MSSLSLTKRIKEDLSQVSLNSFLIDKINIMVQDRELEYLIYINKCISNLIEQKIKHMTFLGDKLNALKKNITILKRSNDENLKNSIESYEILLDIMIIKAEHLSMLHDKQSFIASLIDRKKECEFNSSLEIIVLTH
jgi:hypothetical protein